MGRRTYTLRLDSADVGQILDGLQCRYESWRNTAEYLATGEAPVRGFVAEECSDLAEAEKIAAAYQRIIQTIEMQIG